MMQSCAKNKYYLSNSRNTPPISGLLLAIKMGLVVFANRTSKHWPKQCERCKN